MAREIGERAIELGGQIRRREYLPDVIDTVASVRPIIDEGRQRFNRFTWIRYARFSRQNRINEDAISAFAYELRKTEARISAEYQSEHQEIESEYRRMLLEWQERERIIKENRDTGSDVVPYWGWSTQSEAEIETHRRIRHESRNRFYDQRRSELSARMESLKNGASAYKTEFLTKEAAIYGVPLPKETNEEMWYRRPGFSSMLTPFGFNTLRAAVRRERRDRWEYAQIRIALIVSVLSFGIAATNLIVNSRETHHQPPAGPTLKL
jgi:hypothetical protein